ncbi:hypothetical protein BDB00DRAFT_813664 [Zychaea mexicana]|uniref:uncharacterized protein n=1 Tax=Zychaea mexicana TaxID=64656 RepID=UPI0022FEAB82|nr:uncharacterized protein BDB00DRAFT_813664 [Zychaea mexicana]KAI9495522.1 hypothetical protein BDB00DRAFT_813664 [Zychaea mexicana]
MLILRHNNLSVEELFQIESKMLKIADPKEPYTYSLEFTLLDKPRAAIYGMLLGYADRLGIYRTLGINASEFLDFLIDVDLGYHVNPYHSFYHAADVTIVIYHMLFQFEVLNYLSRIDVAALFIAALCHDIGHPGCNNNYQVNLQTELAIRYNKKSVLESYSCTLAMDLLSKHKLLRHVEEISTAHTFPPTTEDQMRTSIVKMILSTDMVFHYELQENFASLLEIVAQDQFETSSECSDIVPPTSSLSSSSQPIPPHQVCYHVRSRTHSNSNNKNSSSNNTTTSSSSSMLSTLSVPTDPCVQMKDIFETKGDKSPLHNFEEQSYFDEDDPPNLHNQLDYRERQMLCQIILHGADISNALRPWPICCKWSDLVCEEFFRQGELEKEHGLPVSPNMDRDQVTQTTIGLQFGDFVVSPYFEIFAAMFPKADALIKELATNRNRWLTLEAQQEEREEQQWYLNNGSSSSSNMNDNGVLDQIKAPNTPDIEAQKQLHNTYFHHRPHYASSSTGGAGGDSSSSCSSDRGRQPTDMLPDRHILNPAGRRVSVAAGMVVIPDELEERVIGSGKSRRKYLGLRSISDTGIKEEQRQAQAAVNKSPMLSVLGNDKSRRKSEEPGYYLYRHKLKVRGERRLSRGDLVDKCLERQRHVASPR